MMLFGFVGPYKTPFGMSPYRLILGGTFHHLVNITIIPHQYPCHFERISPSFSIISLEIYHIRIHPFEYFACISRRRDHFMVDYFFFHNMKRKKFHVQLNLIINHEFS